MVCKTPHKRMYDTLFEAEKAASEAEHDFESKFTTYRCINHWHITNKYKPYRTGKRGKSWLRKRLHQHLNAALSDVLALLEEKK